MIDGPIEISIVVPVYNSAQIIPELVLRVQKAMQTASLSYELILSDDSSPDNSWEVITSLCKTNPQIKGLRLAKNCGQWCSVLAGSSRASGKYIVTIDDDLEYEPADIPLLYKTITNSSYYIVFGMAKGKYTLQGKNQTISTWRKWLMHKLWNSPPTDSFRIFDRNLVFDDKQFMPNVFLDAYIIHTLDKKFMGYTEVGFNKRFAGVSNVPLRKQINLFLVYLSHFAPSPIRHIVAFVVLLLSVALITILLSANNAAYPVFLPALEVLLLLMGVSNLYFLSSVFWKTNKIPAYFIIEEINQKH